MERSGVRQICGCAPHFGGELWDGCYPAIVSTVLQKDGECFEVWVESENVYTLYHNDNELARTKTIKGDFIAYKTMVKKVRSNN